MNVDMNKMTPEQLNKELIEAMKAKIPQGVTLANILMDVLSIGKEAVYRRFRGEVPFTLSEAILISQKLGVSLDKFSGTNFEKESLLDLSLFDEKDPIDNYYRHIEQYINALKKIAPDSASEIWDTSNRISQIFCMNFESLARFNLLKWLYQHNSLTNDLKINCYEDLIIPPALREKEIEYVGIPQLFTRNYYLWDNMIFQSLINDVIYFKEIDMISDESLIQIKKDILNLIDDMEALASRGRFKTGNEVQIYISHINFDTTYSYVESPEMFMSLIKIYDMNILTSENETVFKGLKMWVQSLKRFSTIISESAEMHRFRFFREQRNYLDRI